MRWSASPGRDPSARERRRAPPRRPPMRLVPGRRDVEEILEDAVAMLGGDALGMKLDAVYRKFLVRKPHHQPVRSEEHTSELQSLRHLVCRLLLEKKNEDR